MSFQPNSHQQQNNQPKQESSVPKSAVIGSIIGVLVIAAGIAWASFSTAEAVIGQYLQFFLPYIVIAVGLLIFLPFAKQITTARKKNR